MGLVNDVFSSEEITGRRQLWLPVKSRKNAPLSLQAIKKSIDRGLQTDLHTALSIELDQYYKCANSEDRKEGVLAFNEKRSPNWRGI